MADAAAIETIASYIEGEAGGEGHVGMQAVANVISNRAKQNFSGYGADLVRQVVAPNQFQGRLRPSEAAYSIARDLYAGNLPDITGGATSYANPSASQAAWARRLDQSNSYQIGRHFFTNNQEGAAFRGPVAGEAQAYGYGIGAGAAKPSPPGASAEHVRAGMLAKRGTIGRSLGIRPRTLPASAQEAQSAHGPYYGDYGSGLGTSVGSVSASSSARGGDAPLVLRYRSTVRVRVA